MPSNKWLWNKGFIEENNSFFCDRCCGFKMMGRWVIDHGCGDQHMTCYGCVKELTNDFADSVYSVSCYYCDTGNTPTNWDTLGNSSD